MNEDKEEGKPAALPSVAAAAEPTLPGVNCNWNNDVARKYAHANQGDDKEPYSPPSKKTKLLIKAGEEGKAENSVMKEAAADANEKNISKDCASASPSSSSGSSSVSRPQSPARGVEIHLDDDEEIDFENDDEDQILHRIIQAARRQGISLEMLGFMPHEDDENVELPFEPPQSLQDVASFIQSDQCRKILILAGAGMSVASGIPDFRSPGNGLYATLQADRLTCTSEQMIQIASDPSHSLDQHLFLENPLPCLEVNREFVLGIQEGRWKATLAHRLVELLNSKLDHKLCRLYTQNIDGLEDQCHDLPHSKRIAVHGSMDEAECAVCHAYMPLEEFVPKMKRQIKDWTGRDPEAPTQSTPIICPTCLQPTVKPKIVLFRSSLPKEFFQKVPEDTLDVDLLLILGTSLGVAPANSIVWRVPPTCMRVLINREAVGRHLGLEFQRRDEQGRNLSRNYFAQGDCEQVALDLLDCLGWLDDLKPLLDRDQLPPESKALLQTKLNAVEENADKDEETPAKDSSSSEKDAAGMDQQD